jgi:hypothetical protein
MAMGKELLSTVFALYRQTKRHRSKAMDYEDHRVVSGKSSED